MTLQRYEHTGGAVVTGLASGVTAGATTCSLVSGTGWPTGAVGPFYIVFDPGTGSEEKVLATTRSGTAISGMTRGVDGTSATSHNSGSANAVHVYTAAEADDVNDHVYTTGRDDHTQYARTDGTRTITGPQTVQGQVTVTTGGVAVTGASTFSSTVAATGNLSTSGTLTATGLITGPDLSLTGLTGATATGRHVGFTASGAPVSGTFNTGDVVVDNTGAVFTCITGGTPGTWSVPVGGMVAHAFNSSVDTVVGGGVSTVMTLAASLVSGLKYEVVYHSSFGIITNTLTFINYYLSDSSAFLTIPASPGRLYMASLDTSSNVVNDVLTTQGSSVFTAGSTGSDTFTINGSVGGGAGGASRTWANSSELYIMRVA